MISDEMPSPATRSSLLSRARNPSDHAAWRELEDRYRELLVRFCCKRGFQHADSEDVVQIVFLNLAKTLPDFAYDRNRGRFRDYLYRTVRNAMSMWHKRLRGKTDQLDSSVADHSPASEGDAETDSLWHEEWVSHHYRLALRTVQATLDARTVEMFERGVNGESAAEIANAYGITEQAVYASRRRIRDRMQELIKQQILEEDTVDGDPSDSI